MALSDLLQSALTPEVVGGIATYLGSNKESTQSTIFKAAIPVLVGALAKNASKPEGAQALDTALNDHSPSILDQIGGYLQTSSAGPGAGILKHVLGPKRPVVEAKISQQSGMAGGQVAQLLQVLAPVVMSALAKQKQQSNLNAEGVSTYLGAERQVEEKKAASPDLLTSILDSDGDGDVMDDIISKAGPLLGSLFGGKG